MRFFRIAALGALAFVSACQVEVVEGPRPHPRPDFCPRIYAPVCAGERGDRQTYPNACEARADGARILHDGECRRREEPRFCTREYDPVCATNRGVDQTFSNRCEAEQAGWRVVDRGPC